MMMRKLRNYIVDWLKHRCEEVHKNGFVVGISGGIDSALVSTLCAHTKKDVIVLQMPMDIHQYHRTKRDDNNAVQHIAWLKDLFVNVYDYTTYLGGAFGSYGNALPNSIVMDKLVMANVQARLRMTALYAFAGAKNLLVAGTGNKVEDFGIGFFTKYGDGGVDLSPIADLYKSEVRDLAIWMEINSSIIKAKPTDGLWKDGRTDEDQIGATYDELEWAMEYSYAREYSTDDEFFSKPTKRQKEVLAILKARYDKNYHKMVLPPVCEIPHTKKE